RCGLRCGLHTSSVESWEAFVKALGSDIPSHFTGKHKSIYKFSKLGEVNADGMEKFRHELIILPESSGFKRVLDFKLGEERDISRYLNPVNVSYHFPQWRGAFVRWNFIPRVNCEGDVLPALDGFPVQADFGIVFSDFDSEAKLSSTDWRHSRISIPSWNIDGDFVTELANSHLPVAILKDHLMRKS
ncbi:hypothetical protein BV898_18394, partial [Hypsibius exemplaris]